MSSRDPIPMLRRRLNGARLELALAGIACRVSVALWQWLLVAAIIVFVDAIWPTAPLVRMVFALALSFGLMRVLWRCVPSRSLRRASPGRLAREIEQRCHLLHNPLITAVQLQTALAVAGPQDVDALLRDRCARRGEEAAHATESTILADPHACTRARVALLAAAAFALIAGLAAPRPIAAVAKRVIDPFGDHPPYTPLTFDISFHPDAGEIVYGDDARVTVRISEYWDRWVDRADLVCRVGGDASTPLARLAMQPEPFDQSVDAAPAFTATVRDVREPMRVMVDTPRGRSEWISLEPRRMPRWVARTATITGPPYAASLPPRRLPLADRTEPIHVLQGSRLSVSATSTLPLRDLLATGVVAPPASLSDDLLDAAWHWSADSVGAHEIELTLVGPTGMHSTPTHLTIEVRPDTPPVASIRQPSSDAAALPDQQFRAAIEAIDDVSIGDMTVSARVQRKGAMVEQTQLPITTISATGDRAMAGVDVDLSQFDLRPGDTVQLSALARDQRPDELGGPQTSELAQSNILIIDEKTYASLAGRPPGDGQSGDEGQGDPSAGEGRGNRESPGDQVTAQSSSGEAKGRTPGETNVQLAAGDGTSQSADGSQPGGSATPGASSSQSGQGATLAANGAGNASPGEGQSASGTPGPAELLAQAQSRSLIERDGSMQPISGRTDPDRPRRHLTGLDDGAAPPSLAASRTAIRVQTGGAGEADNLLAGIPLRYRDLAARYFKRLAEDDRAPASEEKSNHE